MPALRIPVTVKENVIPDLCAWWKARCEPQRRRSLAHFLSDFLECEVAEFRLMKQRDEHKWPLLAERPQPKIAERRGRDKLPAKTVQKILHLHVSQNMNA